MQVHAAHFASSVRASDLRKMSLDDDDSEVSPINQMDFVDFDYTVSETSPAAKANDAQDTANTTAKLQSLITSDSNRSLSALQVYLSPVLLPKQPVFGMGMNSSGGSSSSTSPSKPLALSDAEGGTKGASVLTNASHGHGEPSQMSAATRKRVKRALKRAHTHSLASN